MDDEVRKKEAAAEILARLLTGMQHRQCPYLQRTLVTAGENCFFQCLRGLKPLLCYLEAVAMTIHVAKRVQTLQYLEVTRRIVLT